MECFNRMELEQYFYNRIISVDRWPPRSPDLSLLDYFLFGHLKNSIFRNHIDIEDRHN
jgi:hypothetical protein